MSPHITALDDQELLQTFALHDAAGRAPSHSPDISLGANFQTGMQSLLDESDAESNSADEEEVQRLLLQ